MKAKFRDGLERMYWLKGKTITVVIEKLSTGSLPRQEIQEEDTTVHIK